MITFRKIQDDEPALIHSPMVRAITKIFAYIDEHGAIPLTPHKAFKRAFVNWAAAQFKWPGYGDAITDKKLSIIYVVMLVFGLTSRG